MADTKTPVLNLVERRAERQTPHPATVATLRHLLAKAERGEVQGLVAAYEDKEGATYSCTGRYSGFAMIGAVRCALDALSDVARQGESSTPDYEDDDDEPDGEA